MNQENKNKKGGKINKIFKSIGKGLMVVIILGSLGYGLIWVPSQQLKIDQDKHTMNLQLANLNITKIQNSCQLLAQNATVEFERNRETALSEEEKNQLTNQFFTNCLFAEGLQMQNNNEEQNNQQGGVN